MSPVVRKKGATRQRVRGKGQRVPASAVPSNTRRGLVLEDVLKHAARLFAEKGYSGTSLQDIADAVGLQRTSLYYYFETKEDLLAAMIKEVTVSAAQRNRDIRGASGRSAADRLCDMVFDSVIRILAHPMQMRLLDKIEGELPASLAGSYLESKRTVRDEMIQVIADGIEAGELIQIDKRAAAFALLGMVNWTAWWYVPGKGLRPDEIATIMARLARNALSRNGAEPVRPTSRGIINGIRSELDRLERLASESVIAEAGYVRRPD